MRFLLAWLVIAIPVLARAEARLGARAGGGLDAGLISGKPYPVGTGEIGLTAEWLSTTWRIGIGVSLETVARPGRDLARDEESKLDVMFRARLERARIGAGMGLRLLSTELREGPPPPAMWGVDWIRLDVVLPLTRTAALDAEVELDAYVAWTFGCYLGRTSIMVERPDLVRDVSCGETITAATILGLQLAIASRR